MPNSVNIIKDLSFSRVVYDAVPSPILVVDEDVRIIDHNQAAGDILAPSSQRVLRRRAGEVLHCLNSELSPGGCGRAEPCHQCVIRGSVNRCLDSGAVSRQRARLELNDGQKVQEVHYLVSAAPLRRERHAIVTVFTRRPAASARMGNSNLSWYPARAKSIVTSCRPCP